MDFWTWLFGGKEKPFAKEEADQILHSVKICLIGHEREQKGGSFKAGFDYLIAARNEFLKLKNRGRSTYPDAFWREKDFVNNNTKLYAVIDKIDVIMNTYERRDTDSKYNENYPQFRKFVNSIKLIFRNGTRK